MSFYHQSRPGAVEWCDLQRGEVRANLGMREKDLCDSSAVSIAAKYAKTMSPLSQMCVDSCHFVNLGILWAKRVQSRGRAGQQDRREADPTNQP